MQDAEHILSVLRVSQNLNTPNNQHGLFTRNNHRVREEAALPKELVLSLSTHLMARNHL